MFEPLLQAAQPCPRCGGRRLLATVYVVRAYEQELEVAPDGTTVAFTEDVVASEEPTEDSSLRCLGCGHQFEP